MVGNEGNMKYFSLEDNESKVSLMAYWQEGNQVEGKEACNMDYKDSKTCLQLNNILQ